MKYFSLSYDELAVFVFLVKDLILLFLDFFLYQNPIGLVEYDPKRIVLTSLNLLTYRRLKSA